MSRRCEVVDLGDGTKARVQTNGQELSEADWIALAGMAQRLKDKATPICDSPQVVFEELLEELRHDIEFHPRTLQKAIGPSEIGEPCPRALIAAMFDLPKPPEPPNLRAWVGTCIHEHNERLLRNAIINRFEGSSRFLLETKVTVGMLGGVPLTGSCDVFDKASRGVWDWKSKSKTQLNKHRRNGMGQKYHVQFQCYGLGMENAGYEVRYVGGFYIPRDGEFADIFHHAEPYDRQVALDALERANQLHSLATTIGVEAAMAAYPKCTEEFCRVCGNYRAPYGAPRKPAGSTRELFALSK